MNEPTSPYVLSNQNSPAFWLINNLWMPLAGSFLTNGNLSFIEQVWGIGMGGLCTHAHTSDEGIYILEGQCTFNVGGKTFKANAGTFVSIPRLVEHSFTVDVPNTRLLNWYTPGGFETLIMSIGTAAHERKLPVPNSLALPPRWMIEECSREVGQIPVLGLPFADAPGKDNMITRPSDLNPAQPYAAHAQDLQSYWFMNTLWTILASVEQTGGSYSVIEEIGTKNSGPAPHTHEQDEVLYIIEGEISLIAGSLNATAKAGSLAYIPAHCVHSFRMNRDRTRLLNFYFPGGFEKLISQFGVAAQSYTLPPSDVKISETPEQAQAILQRIGMSMVALPDVLRKPE
jgi:quercetin dioxygenase-like cupin family protein